MTKTYLLRTSALLMTTALPAVKSQNPNLPAVKNYGFLTGDDIDSCLSTSDFSEWMPNTAFSTRVGLYDHYAVNGSLSAIDAVDKTEYEPLFESMQSAMAAFADTSRLATCLFKETAEFISMYNCNDDQLATTEACTNSKSGWVAMISNRKLYSDEGSWHFFEWDNKTKVIGTSLGIDNRTFEPFNVAEWYRAQHQLVEETGCGKPGWYGVNKARAGSSPTELIQFVLPILTSTNVSNDCGTFVGACGAAAVIPKSFNASESYPCEFTVTPIDEGILSAEGIAASSSSSSASASSARIVKCISTVVAMYMYLQVLL